MKNFSQRNKREKKPMRMPTFSGVLNEIERTSFNEEDHLEAYTLQAVSGAGGGSKGGDDQDGGNTNSGRKNKSRLPLIIATLLISVGAVAATLFMIIGITSANHDQEGAFDRISNEVIHSLEMAVDEYLVAAAFVQEATSWQNTTTREEFQSLYRTLVGQNSNGIVQTPMISYIPVIDNSQRLNLENTSRAYYELEYPEFAYQGIQGIEQDSVQYRSIQNQYYPCNYVEPLYGNEGFVDFDLYSVDDMQLPITRVMETGEPTLTRRVGSDPSAYSVLLFHPGRQTINNRKRRRIEQEHTTVSQKNKIRKRLRKLQGSAYNPEYEPPPPPPPSNTGNETTENDTNTPKPTSFTAIQIQMTELLTRLEKDLPEHDAIHVYIFCAEALDNAKGGEEAFLGGVSVIPIEGEDDDEDNHQSHDQRQESTGEFLSQITKDELYERYGKGYLSRSHTFVPLPSDDTTHWEVYVVGASGSYESDTTFVVTAGVLLFVLCAVLGGFIYCNIRRSDKLNSVQAEAQQEKAKLVIQNASKAAKRERDLNDFIAHEVRNPLAAAMTASSFVRSEVLDEQQPMIKAERYETVKEDMEIIDSSLHFINDLLRNMLDMQRAGSKKLQIDMSPTHVLNDVLRPVDCMLHRRGANFDVQIECDPNLVVYTDPLRLKQIILNLARNSVKFVERGFIRLKAVVIEDEILGTSTVQLSVEDSGPGIPAEKQKEMFGKFQESLDSLHQGTGIGLSLCKQLTNLMNAKLWIDEDYDSGWIGFPGARFVVDLNVPPMEWNDDVLEKYESQRSHISSAGEDQDDKSTSLSTVEGPEEEGDAMRHVEFTDTATVTSSGKSSSGNEDSQTTAIHNNQGEDGTMKTVSTGASLNTLKTEDAAEVIELPEHLSVLFVDDDMVLRKLFARSVKKVAPTWKIQEAGSGEAALSITKSESFDVIFMDQYMASVQKQLLGTETTRALRAQGIQSTICGLSANDVEKSFAEAGANSFIFKPFPCKPDALRKELSRVIDSGRIEEEEDSDQNRRSCPPTIVGDSAGVSSVDVWIERSSRI